MTTRTDAISVDPETETLRAACCTWTLETKWADTPLHRRLIQQAVDQHRAGPEHRTAGEELADLVARWEARTAARTDTPVVCQHCQDDPPAGHRCPACGRVGRT